MTLNRRAAAVLLATALWLGASAAGARESRFTPEQVRADFADLYAGLREAHYDLYAHRPKAEYDRLYATMLAGFDRPLTRAETEERFQLFAAYGQVAHARIETSGDGWEAWRVGGGKAFPVPLRFVGGKAFATANQSGVAAGDELLTLDGKPMAEWIERLTRQISADTPYMKASLLEFRFPKALWQDTGPRDRFRVEVRGPHGKRKAIEVAALTRAELEAAEAARPPVFVLDSETREARMLTPTVAYLKPGPFYDNRPGVENMWDNSAFVPFIDAAFEDFIARGAADLIIDLRDNPGGDNSFSDPMIAWFADKPFRFYSAFEIKVSPQTTASNAARLAVTGGGGVSAEMAALFAGKKPGDIVRFELLTPQPRAGKRFTGRVWLLVDRHSFSNTVTVAALVQDYGLGKVLGEETSDLATTFGAMETFKLPRTGIVVGYPKALIVRPNGDRTTRGVVPDIAIAMPVVPTTDDVVLKRALAVVEK